MATRVKVAFRETWRNYVKGDIAGFSPELAENLKKAGIVTIVGEVDVASASESAGAKEQEKALAAMSASLDDREAALARREAELAAREAATEGAGDAKPDQGGEAKKDGAPPAQGKKS